jgi:hypothetical protein
MSKLMGIAAIIILVIMGASMFYNLGKSEGRMEVYREQIRKG